jgi:hypothetical protein
VVKRRPFFIAPGERTELRNLCKVIFSGGNPDGYPELRDILKKYKTIFAIFNVIIDVRYGNFIHLPFEGGAADQPSKTMECLGLMQFLFREKKAEEDKKALRKR